MIQTYEGFRKGKEYPVDDKPYQLKVKYSHGDADLDTTETYKFKTEESMRDVLDALIKVRNFIPGKGYGKQGYYQPITENDGGKIKVMDLIEDRYQDYIQRDEKYDQGYASIEGIALKINNEPYIILDKKAAETNIIELPNPGNIIPSHANHIAGYGSKFDKKIKYLPNRGPKDYEKVTFESKVIDCMIDESEYMKWGITSFPYILLYETDEKVLKSGEDIYRWTNMIYGWDKNFGQKFNKDEFDDLRIYIF